jgi:hypothetical protein
VLTGTCGRAQGLDVQFLKELQLPVMEPIMSNKITLSLYDWDAVRPSAYISWSQCAL